MISSEEEGEIKIQVPTRKSRFEYKIIKQIGEGTFGTVYLAEKNNTYFALKKIKYSEQSNGFPLTTLREVKILKSLKHKNIIEVIEIVLKRKENAKIKRENCELFVVLPYMKYDLNVLIQNQKFNMADAKYIFKQIVSGLEYLHSACVLHRDLKSANILLDSALNVKIADFGLARPMLKSGNYTPGVVTLWYRPPELLLGANTYDHTIDLWGLGCILGELLKRKVLFSGKNEIEQLEGIISVCGSINEKTMPGVTKLPDYYKYRLPQGPKRIKTLLSNTDEDGVDLLDKLLQLVPKNRLGIEKVIQHPFIKKVEIKNESNEIIKKRRVIYNGPSDENDDSSIEEELVTFIESPQI
ncbi:putative CTD kinase subunit alpha like protein [Astathelohania contejeani]|uniref:CTD kinase subunit alpha like protein n=1 Tax=Astathelohania contejeani TaxID=164912 RepID=A0ABQ7HZD2_9MICR|nr:putative CTD kinase subunit alpha like protein [Thelohania contejeani]